MGSSLLFSSLLFSGLSLGLVISRLGCSGYGVVWDKDLERLGCCCVVVWVVWVVLVCMGLVCNLLYCIVLYCIGKRLEKDWKKIESGLVFSALLCSSLLCSSLLCSSRLFSSRLFSSLLCQDKLFMVGINSSPLGSGSSFILLSLLG